MLIITIDLGIRAFMWGGVTSVFPAARRDLIQISYLLTDLDHCERDRLVESCGFRLLPSV